jgi:hypothetical protein
MLASVVHQRNALMLQANYINDKYEKEQAESMDRDMI